VGNPIKLTSDERKRLLEMLDTETKQADEYVLKPLQRQRESWNDTYYGVVKPRLQDWMSNFPIQLGATFTDAILARILNTMFAYTPTFTVKATQNSLWSAISKNVEDLIQFKVETEMQLYTACRKSLFETVRLGTGALLTPWIVEQTSYPVQYMFWKRSVPVDVVNGIVAQHLPIRDLLYPPGYSDLSVMPWWARRMYWTPMMLRSENRRKYYDVNDNVMKALEPMPEFTEEARQRAGELGIPSRIIGWETWLKWDRKEDGNIQRYVATWHPPTGELLRIEEDTYPKWPLTLFRYGPRDYGICGLGVIEMVKPYEDALYALYNLLVDNFKVATMQCFKGKKGANLSANTQIYPTKLFLLDDPANDLNSFPLGQPYSLNPAFMNAVWDLGERRAGISDYALGRESPIVAGKATATGTLALIQEGQRRFDLTIHDVRQAMDDFGMFMLATTHQRLDTRVGYMVKGVDGKYIQQWLEFPAIPPQYALKLVSSVSNVALNREVEKQNAMTTFQLLAQYYEKIIQLVQGMLQAPPQLQQVLAGIATASGKKLQKVLEAYGELSPEQYVNVLSPLLGGQNDQGVGGSAPGEHGVGGAPGGAEGEAGGTSEPVAELPAGSGGAS